METMIADGKPSGLNLDVGGKKLSAGHETVVAALSSLERMWSRTLDWFEDNPVQFAFLIVLIMFILIQRRIGRTDLAAMKAEYEDRRERVRSYQQQPLPLPKPEQNPPRGDSK